MEILWIPIQFRPYYVHRFGSLGTKYVIVTPSSDEEQNDVFMRIGGESRILKHSELTLTPTKKKR